MKREVRGLAGIVAAVVGLALLAQGLWIPAKAVAAQILLERAWERTRGGEGDARPWPWADHQPVARIRVPRLGVSAIVLEGATGGSLAFGPGHLAGSAPPGAPGNAVVAGHRDTHFAFLRDLRRGDALLVEPPAGPTRRYEVTDAAVVSERDTWLLADTATAMLTLVTCFPFDAAVPGGPERYVVRAELLPPLASLRE
jgi:sortase A